MEKEEQMEEEGERVKRWEEERDEGRKGKNNCQEDGGKGVREGGSEGKYPYHSH